MHILQCQLVAVHAARHLFRNLLLTHASGIADIAFVYLDITVLPLSRCMIHEGNEVNTLLTQIVQHQWKLLLIVDFKAHVKAVMNQMQLRVAFFYDIRQLPDELGTSHGGSSDSLPDTDGVKHGGDAMGTAFLFEFIYSQLHIHDAAGARCRHGFDMIRMHIDEARCDVSPIGVVHLINAHRGKLCLWNDIIDTFLFNQQSVIL